MELMLRSDGIAGNVKVLCAVGDFGYGTFNLPQTLIRSINMNKPPQPLLHKTRVRWRSEQLILIKTKNSDGKNKNGTRENLLYQLWK